MKTFEEFLNEVEEHHITRSEHDRIKADHEHLKKMDKRTLMQHAGGGRLDYGSGGNEPKQALINSALVNKHGSKRVTAYYNKRVKD